MGKESKLPACFGLMFSKKAVECVGGKDPKFVQEHREELLFCKFRLMFHGFKVKNPPKRRPPCAHKSACKAEKKRKENV